MVVVVLLDKRHCKIISKCIFQHNFGAEKRVKSFHQVFFVVEIKRVYKFFSEWSGQRRVKGPLAGRSDRRSRRKLSLQRSSYSRLLRLRTRRDFLLVLVLRVPRQQRASSSKISDRLHIASPVEVGKNFLPFAWARQRTPQQLILFGFGLTSIKEGKNEAAAKWVVHSETAPFDVWVETRVLKSQWDTFSDFVSNMKFPQITNCIRGLISRLPRPTSFSNLTR